MMGAIQGLAGIAGGIIGSKGRKKEQAGDSETKIHTSTCNNVCKLIKNLM